MKQSKMVVGYKCLSKVIVHVWPQEQHADCSIIDCSRSCSKLVGIIEGGVDSGQGGGKKEEVKLVKKREKEDDRGV